MSNTDKSKYSSHMKQYFGEYIRNLRTEKGFTLTQLGAKLDLDSANLSKIENGSPLMAKITGMACTATAMVGACLGVEENTHVAAVTAMAIMGVAGDMANDKSAGPGSFQMNFYDSLYELSPEVLAVKVKTNA